MGHVHWTGRRIGAVAAFLFVATLATLTPGMAGADTSRATLQAMLDKADAALTAPKPDYDAALSGFTALYTAAAQGSGDDYYMNAARGGKGMTYAALGDYTDARNSLNESAGLSASAGLPDLAAKSYYNYALVSARAYQLSPSHLLWLAALRNKALKSDYPRDEIMAVTENAQSAFGMRSAALEATVGVKARVLDVDYAYATSSDDDALSELSRARDLAAAVKDQPELLSVADTAVGRFILSHNTAYSQLAFDILQPVIRDSQSLGVQARAVGLLGRLYGLEHRTAEAIALTGEANLLAIRADDISLQLEFGTQYAALLESYGQKAFALQAYDNVAHHIQALQPALAAQTNVEQRANIRQLMSQSLLAQVELMTEVNGDDAATLRRARDLLELEKVIDFETYFSNPCIQDWVRTSKNLDQIDPKTAVLYPVIFDDHVEIIVATAQTIRQFSVPQPSRAVVAAVDKLRDDLSTAGSDDYLAPAQYLYNVLIAPEAGFLKASHIDTLVFAPNDALRGVPLAVLHDGKTYLIHDYAVATALSLSLVDTTPMDRDHPVAVVAGLTHGREIQLADHTETFDNIADVAKETHAVSQVVHGSVLLDGTFTRAGLTTAVDREQPTILHIASHGYFSRINADNFVLVDDAKLTDTDFKALIGRIQKGHGLDLVTLSACQTAAGDDDALLLSLIHI